MILIQNGESNPDYKDVAAAIGGRQTGDKRGWERGFALMRP